MDNNRIEIDGSTVTVMDGVDSVKFAGGDARVLFLAAAKWLDGKTSPEHAILYRDDAIDKLVLYGFFRAP